MKISAVIFDLDGTLIDTEEQWGKAFVDALKSFGKVVTDPHPEVFGVSIEDNWRMLLTKYQIKTTKTIEELVDITYKFYAKYLPEASLISGAREFLESLKDADIKIALATSCEWWVVDKIFDKLGLEGVFDATVTGEETPIKKPLPGPLLLAADKLGVLPADCLVIGDSPTDVEAARNAGMKVIAITNKVKDEGALANADLIVEGFAEVTLKVIEGL